MNLNDFKLDLVERKSFGKSGVKKIRTENKVPVEIYGCGRKNISAAIDKVSLEKAINSKTLFNKLTELNLGENKILAFAKVVQLHSVSDKILHIDFQAVEKGQEISMKIPVRFLNHDLCSELKLGGTLNVVTPYVKLKGKIEDIPEYVDCNLENASVKVSIRMSSLAISDKLKMEAKYEKAVVATILAARKKAGDAAAAAEEKTAKA
jgi:large subunit ribosomal protein L25